MKLYKPNPGFQENFVKSRKKIRLCTAGNKSGKTYTCAWESRAYSLGEHHYKKIVTPNIGVIVTAKALKEGIEKDIMPAIESVVGSYDIQQIKNNPQGTPHKIIWKNKSITYLMSAEQDDVVFEGIKLDHAWLDEPSRRSIYIALLRGLMMRQGHIWYSCTPLAEPWLYEEIFLPGVSGKDKDIGVFEGATDENIYLTEEAKNEFFSRLTEEEIEARRFGKFRHLAGRVFKEYKPENNRIEPFDVPYHWPVWVAIDPHKNKPHMVVYIAVGPDNTKYVCNEIYVKCTIGELAKYILEINEQYNVVNVLADTSIQEDGWERVSARELLENEGLRVKLAQKKNLKSSGILLMNQLFKKTELMIFKTCTRTNKELTLQIYKRNKSDEMAVLEEPEKKWDEATDCIRYVLNERPDYNGIAEAKSIS